MSSSTKEWDVHFCQGVQRPHQPRSGTPSSAKEWDVQFCQGVRRPVLPKSVMSTSAKDCDVPFSQSSQLDWVNSSAVLQSPHTRGPALVLQRSSLHYSHERFRFTHRYRRAWLPAHAINDYFVYASCFTRFSITSVRPSLHVNILILIHIPCPQRQEGGRDGSRAAGAGKHPSCRKSIHRCGSSKSGIGVGVQSTGGVRRVQLTTCAGVSCCVVWVCTRAHAV